MKVEKTNLEGVLIIDPPTNFIDFRGSYIETYNERLYKKHGITEDFIQDDISASKKNVLRGIHGDKNTCKLVTCLYGEFYLVVVNNNPHSQQFKKWQSFNLSDKNRKQVLIPPMYGNGHLVISDKAIFHYKQTTEYNREGQFTIMWNDPEFKIKWPVKNPILSKRDGG
ncbi:dTDP-4-dehydrorhamnose 3,5-epimerase family protein [Candidatus Pelagibacter sp.]|nr:dTDP-4-dehydrorhamnose 3,5-epimerase family protein [Candidatus Pelagibacter sp.]